MTDNASGNRAAAKRLGFVNTRQRRLRVHRMVMPLARQMMYGFMEREQSEIDAMAAALQDWIESQMGPSPKEVPEVSVSCGAYAAAIEVDGSVLWCSETHDSITAESLIQMFRDECSKRAVFAA